VARLLSQGMQGELGSAAPGEPPRIVFSRQSLYEQPNLLLCSRDGMARMQPLTAHTDPTPSLRGIQR